jgi:hypothetical protein
MRNRDVDLSHVDMLGGAVYGEKSKGLGVRGGIAQGPPYVTLVAAQGLSVSSMPEAAVRFLDQVHSTTDSTTAPAFLSLQE